LSSQVAACWPQELTAEATVGCGSAARANVIHRRFETRPARNGGSGASGAHDGGECVPVWGVGWAASECVYRCMNAVGRCVTRRPCELNRGSGDEGQGQGQGQTAGCLGRRCETGCVGAGLLLFQAGQVHRRLGHARAWLAVGPGIAGPRRKGLVFEHPDG
jgi:hypothetical protein